MKSIKKSESESHRELLSPHSCGQEGRLGHQPLGCPRQPQGTPLSLPRGQQWGQSSGRREIPTPSPVPAWCRKVMASTSKSPLPEPTCCHLLPAGTTCCPRSHGKTHSLSHSS